MLGELGLFSVPIGTTGETGFALLLPAHFSVGKFLVCFKLNVLEGYTYLTKAVRSDGVELFRSRHVQREFWSGKFWIELYTGGPYTWYDPSFGGGVLGFTPNANHLHYFDAFRKPQDWFTSSATQMPAIPSTDPADRYAADSSIKVQPEPVFFLADLKDGESISLNTTCYRDDPFLSGSSPTLSDTIPTTADASASEARYAADFSFLGTMQAWMLRI